MGERNTSLKHLQLLSHQQRLMFGVQTLMNLCTQDCSAVPPPPPLLPVGFLDHSASTPLLSLALFLHPGVPVIYPLITGHDSFWEPGHKCETESRCSRFPNALLNPLALLAFNLYPVPFLAPKILPKKPQHVPIPRSRHSGSSHFM